MLALVIVAAVLAWVYARGGATAVAGGGSSGSNPTMPSGYTPPPRDAHVSVKTTTKDGLASTTADVQLDDVEGIRAKVSPGYQAYENGAMLAVGTPLGYFVATSPLAGAAPDHEYANLPAPSATGLDGVDPNNAQVVLGITNGRVQMTPKVLTGLGLTLEQWHVELGRFNRDVRNSYEWWDFWLLGVIPDWLETQAPTGQVAGWQAPYLQGVVNYGQDGGMWNAITSFWKNGALSVASSTSIAGIINNGATAVRAGSGDKSAQAGYYK